MRLLSMRIRFWGISMAGEMLHQGQATERDVNSASARVGFDDLAGTVSGFMQVLFPAVGGWNFFYTPEEGDQVVTIRLPNGTEEGYVLGTVYTAGKMPQGGAKNIFLMVSKDGKNFIRFDAVNGTLDVYVDQTGTEKFKNLKLQVKENRNAEIGIDDILLVEGNQETIVEGRSKHTSSDTDIYSDAPVGLQGTNTFLGADVLQVFFDEVIDAFEPYIFSPPIEHPPGPVLPEAVLINMALTRVRRRMIEAANNGKASCAKALK